MKFTKPEAEITYFETVDVVETSGTTEMAPTTSEASPEEPSPTPTTEGPVATGEP